MIWEEIGHKAGAYWILHRPKILHTQTQRILPVTTFTFIAIVCFGSCIATIEFADTDTRFTICTALINGIHRRRWPKIWFSCDQIVHFQGWDSLTINWIWSSPYFFNAEPLLRWVQRFKCILWCFWHIFFFFGFFFTFSKKISVMFC